MLEAMQNFLSYNLLVIYCLCSIMLSGAFKKDFDIK